MNYEKLRERYLNKLKISNDILINLKELNESFRLIDDTTLQSYISLNKRFLEKLENQEIQLAIIGKENSGKSTVANAIVTLKEAFPTDSKRATYTPTLLRYGKDDKGIVKFFTIEEFEDNFKDMLTKMGYSENVSFRSLNKSNYEEYFNKLRHSDPDLYHKYKSTLHKDILAILKGKNEIIKYLNKSDLIFSKDDIEAGKMKEFITHPYISRAVKEVKIYLSSLKDTKELVLYDVPGFNSLTKKHKDETIKALKEADAILLVKNVAENPEFQSEEIDILSTYDEDGLPLSEKIFLIGAKVDRLNHKEEIIENIKALKEDAFNELGIKEKRIFITSAYAYLYQKGKQDNADAYDKLMRYGLEEYINSIDILKDEIKLFYKNEAFDNLTKQINKFIFKLENNLSSIIEDLSSEKSKEIYLQESTIRYELISSFENKIKDILSEVRNDLKIYIDESQPLSTKLIENIDNKLDVKITLDDIKKENIKFTGTKNEFNVEKVQNSLREKLKDNLTEKFYSLVVDFSENEYEKAFDKIVEAILGILNINKEHTSYETLREELIKYLNELLQGINFSKEGYQNLLDRFSKDLFYIVIGAFRGSEERKNKFEASKKELLGLAFYYEDIKDEINIKNLSLLRLVLGEKLPSKKEYEELIVIFDNLKDVKDIILEKLLTIQPGLKITKHLLEKYLANSVIDKHNINIVLNNFIKEFNNNSNNIQKALTMKEAEKEINEDVEILRDLLKNAVLKAINIDEVFKINVIRVVEKIINSKNTITKQFILKNLDKILEKELSNIEYQKSILEQKKELRNKISRFLNKLKKEKK